MWLASDPGFSSPRQKVQRERRRKKNSLMCFTASLQLTSINSLGMEPGDEANVGYQEYMAGKGVSNMWRANHGIYLSLVTMLTPLKTVVTTTSKYGSKVYAISSGELDISSLHVLLWYTTVN